MLRNWAAVAAWRLGLPRERIAALGAPMSARRARCARRVRVALRRLRGYALRNRGYYAVWIATTLAYVAGFVAVPMLVGWSVKAVVDGPAARRRSSAACSGSRSSRCARAVVRYFSRTLVFNAAREIEYELRNDIFAHLQRLPQSFYFRWRTGDIMSRCVNDINAVRLLLGVGLLNLVQTPILYVAVIGAMLATNAQARAAGAAAVSRSSSGSRARSAARSTTGACSRRRGSPSSRTSSRRRSRASRW